MKIKEIKRNATVAWGSRRSARGGELLLASGTAAGALDSNFSSNSTLEISLLDLEDQGLEMKTLVHVPVNSSFQDLAWGSFGTGVLAAAMESGSLDLWNTEVLLTEGGESAKALIHRADNHQGAVRGIDFNPFQENLLASGGIDGEVFIWDMNNPTKPYTPGTKSQKLKDVTCVGWNKQVPHILATSSSNGYTVIWDLKNKREAMALINPTSKQSCIAVAWNPDVATQLITASEDDRDPSLHVWDVRNARAPERILTGGHTHGILSLSWSPHDSGLLLSGGKDNRTLLWNPQKGEVLGELPSAGNWVFDVQWCPKNPSLISTASFDEHVSVYSMDYSITSAPSDSSSDPFASKGEFALKGAPKWLKRPVGATFGFGGKLVTFFQPKAQPAQGPKVTLHTVSTNQKLVDESVSFESTMNEQKYHEFCYNRMSQASTPQERGFWSVVNILLGSESREELVKYLGFSREDLEKHFGSLKLKEDDEEPAQTPEATPEPAVEQSSPSQTADELFEDSPQTFDFSPPSTSGANEVLPTLQQFTITSEGTPSAELLITNAIIASNFKLAVDLCFKLGKPAEALVIASCGDEELQLAAQKKFLASATTPYLKLVSALVHKNLDDVVQNADLKDWRHILAFVASFSGVDQFEPLCETLGRRLHRANNLDAAVLCYICAADLAKVVDLLSAKHDLSEDLALQQFIEKITLLKVTMSTSSTSGSPSLGPLYAKYAEKLAVQGQLTAAMRYLTMSCPDLKTAPHDIAVIADRIFNSGSIILNGLPTPPFPFEYEDVSAEPKQAPQTTFKSQSSGYYGDSFSQPSYSQPQPAYAQPQSVYTPPQPSYSQPAYSQPTYTQPTPTFTQPTPTFAQPTPTFTSATPAYQPPAPTNTWGQTSYTSFAPAPASVSPPPATEAKSPVKAGNWNDPPIIQPKQKGPTQAAPIFTPVANTFSSPTTVPSQPPFQPPPTFGQPPSVKNIGPPPVDVGPPKGGFQKQEPPAVHAQSILPKTGLIPQPNILQQTMTPPAPQLQSQQPFPFVQPPQPTISDFKAPAANPVPQQPFQPPPVQYSAQPQQTVQPKAAPPPKKKAVSGDRSKIPKEHMPIFTGLSAILSRVEKSCQNPQQKKIFDDTKKRVEQLFDKLNEGEVPEGALPGLFDITKALEARSYDGAMNVHMNLITGNHGEGISGSLVGLKRLVELARASQ